MQADVAGSQATCEDGTQFEGGSQLHVDAGGEVLFRQQWERRPVDTVLTERLREEKSVMV